MRAVIQRVTHASVTIEGSVKSQIGPGYLILLGICDEDSMEDVDWLVKKIANLRVFGLSFVRESIEMTTGDTVQLSLLKEPATGNEAITWKSSNEEIVSVDSYGLLIALKDGSVEVTATSAESQLVATMPVTVKKTAAQKQGAASNSGKKDLGYATFEGPMQNGKPHGNGTLYFKQSHVIPGTVNVTAEAGEKVIGSFREGRVNVGTLYRKNGNQVVVRAGQEF